MCSQNNSLSKMEKSTSFSNLHHRFPAYGKILLKMRKSGLVPIRMVMVTFDWNVARAYPRIVIPDDIPLESLNVSYLAGLPVQIVYQDKDAQRVTILVEIILRANPSFLATFDLDLLDTGHARVIISPCRKAQKKMAVS